MIGMNLRSLPLIGALLAALGLGGFAWWQQHRAATLAAERDDLRASLTDARAALLQQAEAAAVHRAWIARLEQSAAAAAAELETLKGMEGRDAPLSPLLRATGAAADRILRR